MAIEISTSVDFNALPREIRLEIFSYLSLDQRLEAAKISRIFRDLAYDQVEFRKNYEQYNDDESSIKEIQDILRDARSFNIDITQVTYENIKTLKANVEQIRKDSIIKIWEKIINERTLFDYLDDPNFIQLKDKTYSEINAKFDVWINKNKDMISSLTLSFCNLRYLPDSIGNLKNLVSLSLDNNKISTIPVSIGNLSNLEYLYLSNNQISTLSGSIGNLTKLKTLSLLNNNISSLPDSIGNLTELEELRLFGNPIRTLPDCLQDLSRLKKNILN
ncbi:MAG: hypothetical protein K1060chlam4_00218 [Candidatus Anoxychlamydiales bacterium]|nr:hypothetical protein [Candidatus Anoxychlamydiales bacterium]